MTIAAGERVRFKTPCAWPARAGLDGTVVAAAAVGVPEPPAWESIVLLDDDPLPSAGAGWSCRMWDTGLEVIG